MANLSVIDGVLQYRETSYQVSQITSVKPVTVRRKRIIDYVSLKPILPLLLVAAVLGLIGASLFQTKIDTALVFLLIMAAIVAFCFRRVGKRISQNREDTHFFMYGISLYLANGDRELFVSSNKEMILDVCGGVAKAMKGNEGILVNFADAKIEINNSENVTIGSLDS